MYFLRLCFHLILLYIILFTVYLQIEDAESCYYDSLSIGEETYCGHIETTVAFRITSDVEEPYIAVSFISDGSVTDLGFAIYWELSGN